MPRNTTKLGLPVPLGEELVERQNIDDLADGIDQTVVALAGDTMTGILKLYADPVDPMDAATKQYVDNLLKQGMVKDAVRVVATTDVTKTGVQTVDGVVLAVDDRVLLTGQATASQNGIWQVKAGAWVRTSDADNSTELKSGILIPVKEGTAYANTFWTLTTDTTITVDTTALSFTWAAGLTGVTAAQFDNSTKLATTAFVKRQGLQFAVRNVFTADTTLTASQAGTMVYGSSTNPITLTMPLANTCPAGTIIYVENVNTGTVTVSKQGTDSLYLVTGTVNSVVLSPGDTVILEGNGTSYWRAVGGSAQLPYAGVMEGPNWTTPPQFDSTKKLATTEFVKTAGKQYAKINQYETGPLTLTAANCGGIVDLSSGYTGAITLPAVSSLVDGAVIEIWSGANASVTVQCQGTDVIFVNNNTIASMTLNVGDTLVLIRYGGGSWLAAGGTAQIPYSTAASSPRIRNIYGTAGTYTFTAPRTGWYKATVIGAGGGGGGIYCTVGAAAGGGGGGGAAIKWVWLTAGQQVTTTVGAGGAGGALANGWNGLSGGTSSFGAYCSATGGTGGVGQGGPITVTTVYSGATGGYGQNGDVNVTGSPGSDGTIITLTAPINAIGGNGGGAAVIGGGTDGGLNVANSAGGYGAGGAGASVYNAALQGGFGFDGCVIIEG
jgi:hypothetical protein